MKNLTVTTAITFSLLTLSGISAMAQTGEGPMSAPATLDRPYGSPDAPPYQRVPNQTGNQTHMGTSNLSRAEAIALHSSVGTVSRLEPGRHVMMLDDGAVYQLERAIDISRLTPGERVEVRYRMDGAARMASAVIPLQSNSGSSTMMAPNTGMDQSTGNGLATPAPADRGETGYGWATSPAEWHSRTGSIGRDDIPGLPRRGDAMGSGLYNGE